MSHYDEYLEFAKSLALKAGEIMQRYFDSPEISVKDNTEIVTVADQEINQMVINEVEKRYPGHSVYGEEKSTKHQTKNLWSCDPIDGTNLFSRSIPMCVFSLAFVEDGVPKLGVVYSPFQKSMYWAVVGGGAYLNDKKIHVSDNKQKNKVMNFDWWSLAEFDTIKAVEKLSKQDNVYLISLGSTTHAGVLVASGKFVASIFSGTTGKSVDISAVKVIVEEAGGKVTDFYGNDQRYDGDLKGAVVSNGKIHDLVIQRIKEEVL